MRTEERKNKIVNVLKKRQNDATIVIEDIHDPHNVSAIFRSADAVGISEINLVYKNDKFPKIGLLSSSSANKWVEKIKHKSLEDCFNNLKKRNFTIYATSLNEKSKNYFEFDFTKPTAFVVGNEHSGVSTEAIKLADEIIQIPMMGMVQSLNVSVATAVLLFEMFRQRFQKNHYKKVKYSSNEFDELLLKWLRK